MENKTSLESSKIYNLSINTINNITKIWKWKIDKHILIDLLYIKQHSELLKKCITSSGND